MLALLDYENLCQWVVGLPRELRIAQHITQRKIRLEAPDNYMYSHITATLRSIQVAHTYSGL